jgi:hypothetical protein
VPDQFDHPNRLATQLLLIGRSPATGRLHHPRVLDIGLRAATFSELILEGRMISRDGAPFVFGPAQSGDHVLDTVASAVAKRQNVQWWRWYRHSRTDRLELIRELVACGRWTKRRGGMFSSYEDADDLAAQAMAQRLEQVRRTAEITDARQGVLAVLSAMCGTNGRRPDPRSLRKDLKPLLDQIVATSEPNAEHVPSALVGAAVLMRKPTRR